MPNPMWFENLKVYLFKTYGKSPGKMLVHTGVAGWILSSAAQIVAIMCNDKLSKEQKMFMVPQEFADAIVNIVSFYAVTQSVSYLASKLVSCGKLLPKSVHNYIIKSGLGKQIGKFNFDIAKHVKMPKDIRKEYELFKNGTDVIGAITGSVISCNLITPVLRNIYASHRQHSNIAKYNDLNPSLQNGNKTNNPIYKPAHIQTFMNSGSLKV